jgi:hypothetical protein
MGEDLSWACFCSYFKQALPSTAYSEAAQLALWAYSNALEIRDNQGTLSNYLGNCGVQDRVPITRLKGLPEYLITQVSLPGRILGTVMSSSLESLFQNEIIYLLRSFSYV